MTSLTPTGGAGSSSSHSLSPSSVSALVADVDATVPDDLWFIGILFAAMTNLFGTLAKHCFRRAALVRSSHRMYALYGLGLLFVMCEPPGDMIALSFAPMAIVTSCSGLTNVFNLLLAPCTLGEKLTRVRVGSALAVLVGTIGVGCFGPHEHRDRTAHEYILLFSTHRVIFYYVCLVTWLLVAAAIAYMNRFPGARLFGAAFAGTLLGNNIMTKIVVQLVICAADGETHAGCDGENPLHTWEMYIFFLLAVGIAMGGMVANAITLRSAEALDAITIFQGFLLIFGAMSSYFVLNEQVTLSTSRATGYIVSLITIVCGLGFLVLHEVGVLQLDDRSVQSQCYDKPASAIRECLDNLLGERDKDPHDKPAGTAGAPDEATSLVKGAPQLGAPKPQP